MNLRHCLPKANEVTHSSFLLLALLHTDSLPFYTINLINLLINTFYTEGSLRVIQKQARNAVTDSSIIAAVDVSPNVDVSTTYLQIVDDYLMYVMLNGQ